MLGSELQGEDFAKKMVDLVNQRKKYFAEERARAKRNKPMTQSQLKTYMMNYLKNQGTWKLSQLKNLSFEEVKGGKLQTKTPKRMKDDEAKDDEPTKKSGKRRKQMARRGLHTNIDKDDSEGSDEVSEQDDSVTDDLTELYRIVMNRYGMDGPEDELEKFTMSNQHKNWLVQEQTALGKDFSNPCAKGLTSPEQTATGKGISNPFMAVMVCQKPYGIQLTNVFHVLRVEMVFTVNHGHTDLREKLEMTKLAKIDADFTRCCMRFQESFHPHLLNVVAGRRWLLTHGMKLLVVKCLNSNEYIEPFRYAFGRAIEKGMQEGLAAGIEHGQAGRCLTDLEAYIPSVEDDFNSAIRDLRDLNFPLLQELSDKKDASTWDIMDLLRLDDIVAETLGMTDLQPNVSQLMVPVHHKQDRVVIGSQALSVALDICRGRVEKIERNLIERLPFLKGLFVSIDDPLSAEALIEPPVEVPATNVLSTAVIAPHTDPSVFVEDYDNPDLANVVPENATLGSEGGERIDASARGDLAFSQLDDEARDAVL
ncbi:hypothetical protein Tco_1459452 [Tanacetum coccineum]